MNNDLISREALKKAIKDHFDNLDAYFPSAFIKEVEDTPTVSYPFYQEAYQTGYEEGKNERPQGELAEKLKDRIEESVCKYCQMNKHCELCEISRVFSIIALTDKEMKEGAT